MRPRPQPPFHLQSLFGHLPGTELFTEARLDPRERSIDMLEATGAEIHGKKERQQANRHILLHRFDLADATTRRVPRSAPDFLSRALILQGLRTGRPQAQEAAQVFPSMVRPVVRRAPVVTITNCHVRPRPGRAGGVAAAAATPHPENGSRARGAGRRVAWEARAGGRVWRIVKIRSYFIVKYLFQSIILLI